MGVDENGWYRRVQSDGRVIRVDRRWFNSLLTVSASREAITWDDGW